MLVSWIDRFGGGLTGLIVVKSSIERRRMSVEVMEVGWSDDCARRFRISVTMCKVSSAMLGVGCEDGTDMVQ